MMTLARSRLRHSRTWLAVAFASIAFLLLAACGDSDDGDDDIASEPQPTPTEEVAPTPEPEADPTATPELAETATPQSDDTGETPVPEPTPTPEPELEPAEDVELAPELAGLTEWRNLDPVTLEDLRGEPVVLVFWNSI